MAKKRSRCSDQGRYLVRCYNMLKSDAYRDLNPAARCLLEELQIAYNGSNNGELSISTHNAKLLLKVSEPTGMNAFWDLYEHGFIDLMMPHLWKQHKAREWRLTFESYRGREPSNDWMMWKPNEPVKRRPVKKT